MRIVIILIMHFHVSLAIGLVYSEDIHTHLRRCSDDNLSKKYEDKC